MIVTLTAASGTGKTTLMNLIREAHPDSRLITSTTTRPARDSDLPGEYENITLAENRRLAEANEFLWNLDVHGNFYSLRKSFVDDVLQSGKLGLICIVPPVVPTLQAHAPGKVVSFFLLPPDETELRHRLRERGEDDKSIERRISDCRAWEADARAMPDAFQFLPNKEKHEMVEDVLAQVALLR